jgi:ABC-2 type transport system permease protein
VVSLVLVVAIVVIGRIAYGVRVPDSTLPGLVLAVALGAACFCCLSFAVASFIRNEDSAQPVVQATMLPLYFISGVFIPKNQIAPTLHDIGSAFPVSHLNNSLFKAFDPSTTGAGIAGHDMLVVAIWGVAGLVIALRRFSWAPRGA